MVLFALFVCPFAIRKRERRKDWICLVSVSKVSSEDRGIALERGEAVKVAGSASS